MSREKAPSRMDCLNYNVSERTARPSRATQSPVIGTRQGKGLVYPKSTITRRSPRLVVREGLADSPWAGVGDGNAVITSGWTRLGVHSVGVTTMWTRLGCHVVAVATWRTRLVRPGVCIRRGARGSFASLFSLRRGTRASSTSSSPLRRGHRVSCASSFSPLYRFYSDETDSLGRRNALR